MARDWIDQEYERRRVGIKRPLDPGQHEEVNARYPGCTKQHCVECENPTGRCEEDSIYVGDRGPLCEECRELISVRSGEGGGT